MKTFGEVLRESRLAVDLSQEALAEAADVSLAAISSYERGLRLAPHRKTVQALADALSLFGKPRSEFEAAALRRRVLRPVAELCSPAVGNLPLESTSFVGRDREVDEATELLYKNRLLTVTGPGGIGKTRLALQVASRLRPMPEGGAWFIDFSSIHDPRLIENRIASVLGLTVTTVEGIIDNIVEGLRGRDVLLVFDNCEHLTDAVGTIVTAVLERCPRALLLATSRERLRVNAECVYRIAPLSMPSETPVNALLARAFSAVALFVERCERSDAQFVLTDQRVGAVVDICRRLDGIPLALELAAARLTTLGLNDLRSEIALHVETLAGGYRDKPARHQTLRATLDWSFSLLTEAERLLLERLAIFRGGCTLAAAKTVCIDERLHADTIAALLSSLVEKSLVILDTRTDRSRYVLLEATRAYAFEKMKASGSQADLARRHAEWCAAFADDTSRTILAIPVSAWLGDVGHEFGNIYQGVEWGFSAEGDIVVAGRIVGGLRAFWSQRGRVGELYALTSRILERLDVAANPSVAAAVYLAHSMGEADAFDILRTATDICKRLGDTSGLLSCYMAHAYYHGVNGRIAELQNAVDDGIALARACGMTRAVPLFLAYGAQVDIARERYDDARETLLHAFDLMTAAGSLDCMVILSLAELELRLGEAEAAARRAEWYATAADAVGESVNAAGARALAASCWLRVGESEHAEELARATLRTASRLDNIEVKASVIMTLATVAAPARPAHAARLLGFAGGTLRQGGHTGNDNCEYCVAGTQLSQMLQDQLGSDELARYVRQGGMYTDDAAMKEALTI